jgi:hypothetical protein
MTASVTRRRTGDWRLQSGEQQKYKADTSMDHQRRRHITQDVTKEPLPLNDAMISVIALQAA